MSIESKEYIFNTNINCNGCVAAVKPHLDQLQGVEHWAVDTTHKNKLLKVKLTGIPKDEVIQAVKKAGYKIEHVA